MNKKGSSNRIVLRSGTGAGAGTSSTSTPLHHILFLAAVALSLTSIGCTFHKVKTTTSQFSHEEFHNEPETTPQIYPHGSTFTDDAGSSRKTSSSPTTTGSTRNDTAPAFLDDTSTSPTTSTTTVTHANENLNNTSSSKRAFICITGQTHRVTLQSKIDDLFKPLRKAGYTIDVALVLSSTTHSVNGETFIDKSNISDALAYETIDEIEGDLCHFLPGVQIINSRGRGSNNDSSSSNNNNNNNNRLCNRNHPTPPFVQVQDPLVHPEVIEALDKQHLSSEQLLARGVQHVRQFHSLAQCYTEMMYGTQYGNTLMIVSQESQQQSRLYHHNYDLVARLRDDIGFLAPVDMARVERLLDEPPGRRDRRHRHYHHHYRQDETNHNLHVDALNGGPRILLSSACRTWHGMNDRLAILRGTVPGLAQDYFQRPFFDYYAANGYRRAGRSGDDDNGTRMTSVRNPETFLAYVYGTRAGIMLVQDLVVNSVLVHRTRPMVNSTTAVNDDNNDASPPLSQNATTSRIRPQPLVMSMDVPYAGELTDRGGCRYTLSAPNRGTTAMLQSQKEQVKKRQRQNLLADR